MSAPGVPSSGDRGPGTGHTRRVSVVLPTHGRRDSLLRTLRALARQTVPPGWFEVIVVCDGDVDGSYAACARLTSTLPYSLVVVQQPQQGPAAARNRGIAEATAPLIAFIDDDVVPVEGWLSLHLAGHGEAAGDPGTRASGTGSPEPGTGYPLGGELWGDGPVAGVPAATRNPRTGVESGVATIGPLLPPLDTRLSLWGSWEERTLCRQYDGMRPGGWAPTYRQFYTGNAMVPKEQLLAAGGFDSSFRRAEDVELALRLAERGLAFRFLPEAEGRHYVQRRFAAWERSATAYGVADVRMARAGHPWILDLVGREFRARHLSVRLLALLVAGRPGLLEPLAMVLGCAVRLADVLRAPAVGLPCCSVLFNLRYYAGLAAALGGRAAFRAALTTG